MKDPLELSSPELAVVEHNLFGGEDHDDRQDYRVSYDHDLREYGIITAIYNLGWLMGSADASN